MGYKHLAALRPGHEARGFCGALRQDINQKTNA
jgi:hypothetical protein